MLTTSTAPTRTAPRPTAPTPSRPQRTVAPLRVITDAELQEFRRRARARRLLAAAGVLVAVGLFGVVIAHVMLMQGQFELQQLQQRSAASQAEYDRLRLQVSELESPDRIVEVAQVKLGMVAPRTITYLAPSADPAALPSTSAGPTADDEARATAAVGAPGTWSTIKSTLAGG